MSTKEPLFAIKNWTAGDLNALVKNLGEETARGVQKGKLKFTVTEMPVPNLHEFFQTRPGLWVSDDFRNRVLAKVKSDEKVESVTTKSTMLERDMTDKEIEEMLGGNHIFTEAQVCAKIQKMIMEQEGGKEGEFLNNGFANIFYVASCVVSVDWGAGGRGWSVSTWSRGGLRWLAGGRVFSRN